MVLVWACAAVPAPAHAVTLTIDDPSVTEGDAGTTNATFTVTLTSVEANDVAVSYQTEPGEPAYPVDDFLPQSGDLTFVAANGETDGQTSKTITVPVVGDTEDEPIEYFSMVLRAPGLLQNVEGVATIVDEDATIAIGDVTVTEGSTGTSTATFTATVSSTDSGDVTVAYSTADGTAQAPVDYTSRQDGTLEFLQDEPATQTITVPVVGDTLEEPNETFFVNLTGPSANLSITDAQGLATILDDDAVLDPPPATGASGDDGSGDEQQPDVQARVLRRLTLDPSRKRLKHGSAVLLKGRLKSNAGRAKCQSRQKIALQRRKRGGLFQTFEVALTTPSGSFKMSTKPTRTYQYRARVSQTVRCMGATSKVAKVAVRKQSKASGARS